MSGGLSVRVMRRQTVSACAFVVLLVASTVAVTAPAAATGTPQPSAAAPAVDAGAAHLSDSRFNDTAFVAVDATEDGGLVAGGLVASSRTGLGSPNGTLVSFGADGSTEWTVDFESENATRVLDVLAADDGVYFVVSETPSQPGSFRATEVRLGRVTDDGDLTWQRELDAGFAFGSGNTLVDTDDGVAVAHTVPEQGVRLAEYDGGTVVWERTVGIDARVSSLRTTDDGFMLAGTAGFDEPWLLRTTESGRPLLNETYPGIASGATLGAVPTEDGGAVLAGRHRAGYGPGGPSTWTARVDGDGVVRSTRVHDTGAGVSVSQVLDDEDGLLLVGQNLGPLQGADSATTRLVGIGPDGAVRFDETVTDFPRITAVTASDGTLTVAGVTEFSMSGFTGTLDQTSIPESDVGADPSLEPDADLTTGETVWRGQNVRVTEGGPSETYDLVRLPGERDSFDPHVVRRFALDDGEAVLETATLPEGEYVLRGPEGEYRVVTDGRVGDAVDRADATFRVESQRFFRVETDRTFVDVADGERQVSLTFDSEREGFDVYVTADRFRGGAASAAQLRAAFGDAEGFEGVETVAGQPAARVEVDEVDERGEATIELAAAELDPGLYDVTVSGVDTRDGGAVAQGRVVVGSADARPLGVSLENRSLTVAVGERVSTNVTLSNVTHGVGALSMSANLSGDPLVRLRLHADVNASRISSGAGIGPRETETETTAVDGDTANGTVTVGRFGVRAESFGRNTLTNGTNTATFRVDWVVDERGVPYTVPDPMVVTVEVTDAGNATGGSGATTGDGSSSGGESASGSESGA